MSPTESFQAMVALAIVLGIAFNLLPFLIARYRRHRNKLAILARTIAAWPLCLIFPLLGIVAWIVALVWACTRDVEPRVEVIPPPRLPRPRLSNWDKLKAKNWSVS